MRNILLYFLAIFSLSQAAPIIRMAHAPAEIIGFWRLTIAAFLLLPFAVSKGNLKSVLQQHDQNLKWNSASGAFFFLHLLTYFIAAQNTKIANCMIIFATNPLFTAFGAYLLFKEKFTLRLSIAYLIAMFGIYNLVSSSVQFGGPGLVGDLSAVASAVFYAAYVLFGKKARRSIPNLSYSFIIYAITGAAFGVTAFIKGVSFIDYPLQTWIAIAGTIILPTLLGHFLFSYLLNHMHVNLMTCGKLMEPVLASITAFIFLGEILKPETVVAFICTTLAVLLLFFPSQFVRKFISE